MGVVWPKGLSIVRIQDKRDRFIKSMIYGMPGVGKTVLAASAQRVPDMSPVLFIDVDKGTMSIRDEDGAIDLLEIDSWNQVTPALGVLQRGKHKYKTLVLDSITELQKLEIEDRNSGIPSIQDWQGSGIEIRKMLRKIKNLPMNVIVTALEREDRDEATKLIMRRPDLPGKLASGSSAAFDIVARLTTDLEGNTRYLVTRADARTVAKDRAGPRKQLPASIEDPSFPKIWELMFGEEHGNS